MKALPMSAIFHAPTRIVHGDGALSQIPELVKGFGASKPLIVTDKIIADTPAFKSTIKALDDAGISYTLFDGAAIDARLSHIDAEAAKAIDAGTDCIVGIGGGSALCTAKGIAATVTNGGSFADYRRGGTKILAVRPLPNIMAPTTAGAGTEVSQNTIVLDDTRDEKMAISHPMTFPDIAVLDPATLATLPEGLGAASVIDALTHAAEAWLSAIATPITDSYAKNSIEMLVGCARGSVFDKDSDAMAANHLASSMSNIAFGNAGLGMAHMLGGPLESTWHITHGISVGVMLPRIVHHTAPIMPERVAWLAGALGASNPGANAATAADAAVDALYAFYDTINFPHSYTSDQIDVSRATEMTRIAYVASTFGQGKPEDVSADTVITSGNRISITAAEAEAIYADCIG